MNKINAFNFVPNPAPGSYDVEKADKKIHESSPAFSLGVKYKEPKPEEIPGIIFIFSKTNDIFLQTYHYSNIYKIRKYYLQLQFYVKMYRYFRCVI